VKGEISNGATFGFCSAADGPRPTNVSLARWLEATQVGVVCNLHSVQVSISSLRRKSLKEPAMYSAPRVLEIHVSSSAYGLSRRIGINVHAAPFCRCKAE
jgi:hypothetical protein